ncbi:MAG: hypothetical protein RIR65_175, partial [Planctomycetota bacterium]
MDAAEARARRGREGTSVRVGR